MGAVAIKMSLSRTFFVLESRSKGTNTLMIHNTRLEYYRLIMLGIASALGLILHSVLLFW